MLSDAEIAQTYETAKGIEARAKRAAQTGDLAERDAMVNIARHAIALRKTCETCIADRAVRSALRKSA